jgi:hypothetical protein
MGNEMLAFVASLVPWLVPWAGPRFALAVAAGAAALFVVSAAWIAGDLHGSRGRAEAVAACNTTWTAKLKLAETDYAQRIAAAQAEVAALSPTPADRAGVDRLCQQSLACRDRATRAAR